MKEWIRKKKKTINENLKENKISKLKSKEGKHKRKKKKKS